MSDLSILLGADKRPNVVSELSTLADDAVAAQSGITGFAVKGAVATAKKASSDIIPRSINRFLPDLLGDLESHWQEYQESGESDFGAFLEPRADDVAESLLGTADRNIDQAANPAVEKVYRSLRGRGTKLIGPHVAELGRVIERNMG